MLLYVLLHGVRFNLEGGTCWYRKYELSRAGLAVSLVLFPGLF
jgi:hypothetical protein